MSNVLLKWFPISKLRIFGMIHVGALPGTPRNMDNVVKIVSDSLKETEVYLNNGIDGILIENMHDLPYNLPQDMGPEITAAMTRVCSEIRNMAPRTVPCGVQILAGANKEALSVAMAAGLQFIRAEGFVFSHIADEGLINACAGPLLRYRRQIGADDVAIFTDIKKKHSSHSITSDVDIVETSNAAEFFLSDGIILTGSATGKEANYKELQVLKKTMNIPVLVGSGVTADNIFNYADADALIIGSYFKENGRWYNKICPQRIKQLTQKVADII